MKNIIVAQSNRFTSAKYELSVMEKRIFYYLIKLLRKRHLIDKIPFKEREEMFFTFSLSELRSEVNDSRHNREVVKALKSLRLRSFEYEEGIIGEKGSRWFECGFINESQIINDSVIVNVSYLLAPFFIDLTERFTTFSLNVAMSLRSKYSQRLYELCNQYKSVGGFVLSIEDLRNMMNLEDSYNRFALLNKFVLQVAKNELKELFNSGNSDLYFEFSEVKNGRTVTHLKFKIFNEDSIDKDLNNNKRLSNLMKHFSVLFEVSKKPKNAIFIDKVYSVLLKNPDLIEPIYNRILKISEVNNSMDSVILVRHILNVDVIGFDVSNSNLKAKTKDKESPLVDIVSLANLKKF